MRPLAGRRPGVAAALALGASVTELVAVQAVLADAAITAALLHLASVLLMGGCVGVRSGPRARSAMLRAMLLCLCVPVAGGIGVMARGLSALRRDALRVTPPRQLTNNDVTARAGHSRRHAQSTVAPAPWTQQRTPERGSPESADRQDTLRLPVA